MVFPKYEIFPIAKLPPNTFAKEGLAIKIVVTYFGALEMVSFHEKLTKGTPIKIFGSHTIRHVLLSNDEFLCHFTYDSLFQISDFLQSKATKNIGGENHVPID